MLLAPEATVWYVDRKDVHYHSRDTLSLPTSFDFFPYSTLSRGGNGLEHMGNAYLLVWPSSPRTSATTATAAASPAASAVDGDAAGAAADPEPLMLLTSLGVTGRQASAALEVTGGDAAREADWHSGAPMTSIRPSQRCVCTCACVCVCPRQRLFYAILQV